MTDTPTSRSLPSEIKTPADVAAYRDATIQGRGMLPGGPALFDQLCDFASIGAARSESGERECIGDWDMVARELCHRLGAQDGEHMVDMLWKAVDDALRYRFLKSRLTVPGAVHQFVRLNNWPPNTDLRDVDAAIDAAMAPHRQGADK